MIEKHPSVRSLLVASPSFVGLTKILSVLIRWPWISRFGSFVEFYGSVWVSESPAPIGNSRSFSELTYQLRLMSIGYLPQTPTALLGTRLICGIDFPSWIIWVDYHTGWRDSWYSCCLNMFEPGVVGYPNIPNGVLLWTQMDPMPLRRLWNSLATKHRDYWAIWAPWHDHGWMLNM